MARVYPQWKFIDDLAVLNPNTADGFQTQYTVVWRPGMALDFRDIRFASVKGRKLSYWIQKQTDGVSAVIWVALPANDKKIHMYYGNGVAESESDIKSSMEYGDDFDDGSIDPMWTAESGAWTESGGVMRCSGGFGSRLSINSASVSDFVMEMKFKPTSTSIARDGGICFFRATASNESTNGYWCTSQDQGRSTGLRVSKRVSGSSSLINDSGYLLNVDDWQNIKIVVAGTTIKIYVDDVLKIQTTDSSFSSGNIGLGMWGTQVAYWDDFFVRKYAASEPTLSLIRTRSNVNKAPLIQDNTVPDTITAGTTVNTIPTVLLDRISAGVSVAVAPTQQNIMDIISGTGITDVISNDKFVGKVVIGTAVTTATAVNSIKAFADIDNYNVENVSVSKSINDVMWQLTATIDGQVAPAEFRHLNFSRADIEGVTRHLFTGIIPDTRYTLQIAQNKIAVTAFDYGWYLSAQYVPSDMLVMNLDGDYSSWDEWIKALLEETGIIAYKLTTCTEVSSKEFVFDEKTTKQDAINEIAEATGFIFSVQWVQVGNTYEPAAYFIDPDYVDDSINGLDLPADTTISWPDKSLIDIPTLQSPTDEKINRVKVRGCDSNGNWYSATVESSEVSNREVYPREYYYESGDLDTQTKVNARAASLFAYFTSDSYTVEATFIKRFDLRLFQKIRFTGSGFPSKLTELGWLRIISITYSAENVNERVTIKAVVNRDVSLLLSEINTYLGDGLSNEELVIDSKLSSLNTTPLIGTVQSISGNIATILTEDGKTIKARIIS